MENTKLFKLFDNLIYKQAFKKDYLTNLGFNDEEINELIKNEVVLVKKDGDYIINTTKGICNYAFNLLEKDPDKALKYLEMCFEIGRTHYKLNIFL